MTLLALSAAIPAGVVAPTMQLGLGLGSLQGNHTILSGSVLLHNLFWCETYQNLGIICQAPHISRVVFD